MGPRFNNPNQQGLITSLLTLGAFFGNPTSGYVSDKYGRRKAIVLGCIIFLLGGTLQTAAQVCRKQKPHAHARPSAGVVGKNYADVDFLHAEHRNDDGRTCKFSPNLIVPVTVAVPVAWCHEIRGLTADTL